MTATETLTIETPKATSTTTATTTSRVNDHNKRDATEQPKIIRKVGLVEGYFHAEIECNASINAATILFKSKLDLFTNIELVNRAIRLWKRTQPFLRARVLKNPATNECYFAHVDNEEEIDSLKNVSYMYLGRGVNGEKSTCREEHWKMLIEREVTIPIDWQDGPMWRLMFIELNKKKKEKNLDSNDDDNEETNGVNNTNVNEDNYKHEYCLIITVSHAIFDGISAFAALVSLFLIIQALESGALDEKRDIVDAQVVDPVEVWLHKYLASRNMSRADLGEFHQIEPFMRPKSLTIGPDEKRTGYESILNDDEDSVAFYSALDHKPVIWLRELRELSERSVTKFHLTTFAGEKFKRFAAKCKQHKAKVNSVLNLIFIMAWRRLYRQLETDESTASKTKINYISLVNIRPFVKDMDPSLLLWFCNFMNCSFDGQLNPATNETKDEEEFWSEKFWDVARFESEKFHDRLRAGELFRIGENRSECNPDHIRLHYGLSNLVVPVELVNEIKLMKLDALYSLSSYRRDWTLDMSYNTVISIDGETCWTLYYNSYFVKKQTIELFHKHVCEIYDKLC